MLIADYDQVEPSIKCGSVHLQMCRFWKV